jgi:proton-dependent oligopeptide transporter, POT family
MSEEQITEKPVENVLKHTIKEITQPFIELFKVPRALWGVNMSYLLEGITYFGVVGLLAIYFNDYIGLTDIEAGPMLSFQTGGITLAMLFLGATVDVIGVRRAILIALSIMMSGRILLAASPVLGGDIGLWSSSHFLSLLGILGVIIGYGIYQPACYTAVRKFTDEKTAAMGYAMLYALMNLGGFLPGLISPPTRHAFGITGVFWLYAGLTALGIIIVFVVLTKKSIKAATSDKIVTEKPEKDNRPLKEKVKNYIKRIPFTDGKFMFFIFILIPVQTLFAHNWFTLPLYCARAFTGIVQDNFEFFVNFNPILIFILAPMIAVYTAKKHTYKMMVYGTSVMALAPFLLAFGPNVYMLFGFIIVMTIGEAMWQPRFLQWVAEIAPKDMTGIYMGLGQLPWFLTKTLTGFYSGWFLTEFCPKDVDPSAMHSETMWLIYGFIAIVSPISLLFARKWMIKDFKSKV